MLAVETRSDRLISTIFEPTPTPVATKRIVVIIPAYNEERCIGSVVLSIQRFADTIIVVDDGSSDMTAEIAEAAGACVIRHEVNQGKGVALNTGFQHARLLSPDVVITIDADGQHVPGEIMQVAGPVLAGRADIVVGSRYIEHTSDVPRHRVVGHHVFNFVTRQASGVAVSDSQSGFRAFSGRALAALSFRSHGFSVESEMQFLAREHGLMVDEVPITIHYHDKPKRSVVGQGMSVLNGILKLVSQYRPMLFFGLPSLVIMLAGLIWGIWVVNIYHEQRQLAVGYALISVLLSVIGTMGLFTGVILHATRGLLLELIESRRP